MFCVFCNMTPFEIKLIAVLVVTVGSVIFGGIPALLGLGGRYRNSIVLSSILCFGGGVLFATSVIHILPDVRAVLPKYSELVLCLGFLLMYSIDSFIIFLNDGHPQLFSEEEGNSISDETVTNYGSIDVGTEPFVASNGPPSRLNSTEQQRNCVNIGLLIAFTVHALLEGLVIGIQDTEDEVLLLLGAVCSHKFLVAFCFGAELIADGRRWQSLICPMGIFIFGSDLGILVGMSFLSDVSSPSVSLIEGLAGGTLLYIALCEIIPREKARKLRPIASLVQFGGLTVGFFSVAALTLLI